MERVKLMSSVPTCVKIANSLISSGKKVAKLQDREKINSAPINFDWVVQEYEQIIYDQNTFWPNTSLHLLRKTLVETSFCV